MTKASPNARPARKAGVARSCEIHEINRRRASMAQAPRLRLSKYRYSANASSEISVEKSVPRLYDGALTPVEQEQEPLPVDLVSGNRN
jgi:hypothetical protein